MDSKKYMRTRLPPAATMATAAGGGGGCRKTREWTWNKKTLRGAKENSPLAKAVECRSPLVVNRCTTARDSGGKAVEVRWWLGRCCRRETAPNRSSRNVAQSRQIRRRLAASASDERGKEVAGEGGRWGLQRLWRLLRQRPDKDAHLWLTMKK